MLNFVAYSPIAYEVAVVNRKEAPDKISLSTRLEREISKVIEKHKAFFDNFENKVEFNKKFNEFVKRDFIELNKAPKDEILKFMKKHKIFMLRDVI